MGRCTCHNAAGAPSPSNLRGYPLSSVAGCNFVFGGVDGGDAAETPTRQTCAAYSNKFHSCASSEQQTPLNVID